MDVNVKKLINFCLAGYIFILVIEVAGWLIGPATRDALFPIKAAALIYTAIMLVKTTWKQSELEKD